MKRMMVGVVLAFLAGVGQAADPGAKFYWKAGSGNWSDVGNWYSDSSCTQPATRYPGGDANITDDSAYFVASMPGGTITVDKDITIYKLYVYKSNAKGATSATAPVTFDGGEGKHTIATTTTSDSVSDRNEFYRSTTFTNIKVTGAYLTDHGGTGMNLTLGEGADVTLTKRIYIWADYATLTFEEGCKYRGVIGIRNANNSIVINGGDVGNGNSVDLDGTATATNAVLSINGGKTSLNVSSASATDRISITGGENVLKGTYGEGAAVEITGGRTTWNTSSKLDAKALFSFTGGTLILPSVTDRRLLGTGNAVCIATGDDYSTVNVFTNASEDIRFDATLYVTNKPATGSMFCGFRNASNGMLYGDGTLYVGRLYCDDVTNHYRISKIYLGNGLYFDTSVSLHDFSTGAHFGSWGDWGVNCHTSMGAILFGGELSVDLIDPFDAVTPHAVSLSRFRALSDTTLSVAGAGGSLSWNPIGDVTDLSAIELGEGVTFEAKGSSPVSANRLVLGKDATLKTTAGKAAFNCGSLTADPTARIEVEISADFSADYAGAILNVADGETDAESLAGLVTLTGAGAANWTVASANGCAYYRNATAYDYDAAATKYGANFWTGASPDGNCLNDPKNWHLGSVPPNASNSTKIYFGGFDNLTITNNLSSEYRFKQMRFVKECGPVVFRGDPLYPSSYSYFDADGSSIVAQSPFPVVFETDVISKANRLEILADGGSYVALNGYTFTSAAGGLYLRGHLRIGGSCHVGSGIYFNNTSGSLPTAIEVMSGALLSVSNQATYAGSTTYTNPFKWNNSFRVRKGGRVEFIDTTTAENGRSMVGWTVDNNLTRNVVDGEFDVQCPLIGWAPMRFSGTGTLNIDSTITTNQNSSLVIGGGLTLTSRGAFHTVTDNDADHFMNVEITDSAVLAAPEASWVYGPQDGVTTETSDADRALCLRDSASILTVASTNGYAIAFGDPIRGRGTLRIVQAAKVALSGELESSAVSGWTELARVGVVEGLPDQTCYRFKTVENDDGTVSLMAKVRGGSLIILR